MTAEQESMVTNRTLSGTMREQTLLDDDRAADNHPARQRPTAAAEGQTRQHRPRRLGGSTQIIQITAALPDTTS